ncbi:MAG: hypothetical protein M1136_03775 [Chloroflexi bacterium]|nr:hypothetical protein [Chloroflexota bacterium]MCL5074758.1 hypothetical protein [Chloroflexota bacterium]
MGGKLRAIVSQICLVDGLRQDYDQCPSVMQPTSPQRIKANKGRLYLILEADGGDSFSYRMVRETIAAEYFADPSLSVTSGLMRAIHTANRRLYEENTSSLPQRRALFGISCAVLRDNDLYLAQVGPSLAYILHGGQLQRIGKPSSERGKTTIPSDVLGVSHTVEISFAHSPLAPGDVIVLCSSSFASMVTESQMEDALYRQSASSVTENLYYLYQVSENPQDFAAVALEMVGRAATEPAPIRNALREMALATSAKAPAATPAVEQDYEELEEAWGWSEESEVGTLLPERLLSFLKRVTSKMERAETATERPAHRTGRPFSLWLLAIVTLIAALLMLVLAMRFWQGQELAANARQLLQKAESYEKEALGAGDATAKRRLLAEADRLASRAVVALDNDKYALDSRARIREELDKLDNVVRLRKATKLVDLSNEAWNSDPSQLILDGNNLYILDKKANRVYKYLLDDSAEAILPNPNPILVRKGDRLGDETVGDLLSLTFMPSGGARLTSALLILDSSGRLFAYDPYKGITPLRIKADGSWDQVKSTAGYAGNLYLLTSKGEQLFWYPSTPGGYDRAIYPYVNPEARIDLSTAIALAVDGDVYILHSTGKIDKFSIGRPQPFAGVPPDVPLHKATALFTTPGSKSLYVLDGGNKRLVEFDKDGRYTRQFRYEGKEDLFADLRSISVDETRGRLYVLSGRGVYLLTLGK